MGFPTIRTLDAQARNIGGVAAHRPARISGALADGFEKSGIDPMTTARNGEVAAGCGGSALASARQTRTIHA
jgi:hypothetical protein